MSFFGTFASHFLCLQLGVIGKKCVQSLIVIHAIRAACMQVIPLHSSAPAPHRFIFFASFGSCSIKLSNQDVVGISFRISFGLARASRSI